jgi:hypothetical protein
MGAPLLDAVAETADVLDPPLLGSAELLDSPKGPPWLGLALAAEFSPVAPGSPSESLEHDATSAASRTHRVAQGNGDKSTFLIDEPPNLQQRTGGMGTRSTPGIQGRF